MDMEYLLNTFEKEFFHFKTNFAEIKKGITFHGALGVGNAIYPIGNLMGLRWIISALKELNYDTNELETRLAGLNSELEEFNYEKEGEYFRILFSDLNKLISYYEHFFKDFHKEKNYFITKEDVDFLYQAYFFARDDGLFFVDEYEFENAIMTRSYIQILLEYLPKYFVTELGGKVKNLDNIFKRDINQILEILRIDKSFITNVSYAPKEYWWLHL